MGQDERVPHVSNSDLVSRVRSQHFADSPSQNVRRECGALASGSRCGSMDFKVRRIGVGVRRIGVGVRRIGVRVLFLRSVNERIHRGRPHAFVASRILK